MQIESLGRRRQNTSGYEHGQRPQGDAQPFWIQNQPGFRFTDHPPGSVAFFAEIERHRYALEPATREMADFARWRGHDVLEAGCGIATDGINFARAGARYVGVDLSTSALELSLLEAHKTLLRDRGIGYLTNRELFLSHNTDGPGNPLSKVYASSDARELFSDFADVGVQARFLNLRVYPLGERLAATNLAQRLERRIGWHLWVHAPNNTSE